MPERYGGKASILFSDTSHLSPDNQRAIKDFILDNGHVPTRNDLEEITGMQVIGRRGGDFYESARAYANELYQNDEDIQKIVQDRAQHEGLTVEDFFWNEADIHEEGTKEGDLFDFYQRMGQAEHRVGQSELARSERDMQVEMSQQRTQLADEVRKRRQNQLRSGLSSAQIANEEIQMLLMGQQAQQETAQQHFNQRTQMNQQYQMNPYTAEMRTREHIQGQQQGAAGMYAAYTGDPIATGTTDATQPQWLRSGRSTFLNQDDD